MNTTTPHFNAQISSTPNGGVANRIGSGVTAAVAGQSAAEVGGNGEFQREFQGDMSAELQGAVQGGMSRGLGFGGSRRSGDLTRQAEPGTGGFEREGLTILHALCQVVAEIVKQVGSDGTPKDLSQRLSLDRKLAWKISNLAKSQRGDAGRFVPGPRAIELFLSAAKKSGVSAALTERAEETSTAFRKLIDRYAGDRSSLDVLLSQSSDMDGGGIDRETRRTAFRANAAVWGLRARVLFHTQILSRSTLDPMKVDSVCLHGLVGLQRMRPDEHFLLCSTAWSFTGGMTGGMTVADGGADKGHWHAAGNGNGHHETGHGENGHLGNGHHGNGHGSNGHNGNGHNGNGHAGNGHHAAEHTGHAMSHGNGNGNGNGHGNGHGQGQVYGGPKWSGVPTMEGGSGDGAGWARPLDLEAAASLGLPVLKDFTTTPRSSLTMVPTPDHQGFVDLFLSPGPVGVSETSDLVVAQRTTAAALPVFGKLGSPDMTVGVRVRTPAELMVHDVIVERGLFEGGLTAEAFVLGDLDHTAGGPNGRVLPMSVSVSLVGALPEAAAETPIPKYRSILRKVFKLAKLTGRTFDVYRVKVEYPVVPSAVVVRCSEPKVSAPLPPPDLSSDPFWPPLGAPQGPQGSSDDLLN